MCQICNGQANSQKTDKIKSMHGWSQLITDNRFTICRPPNGCLQYWITMTGRITTFNFWATDSIHLANQE